MQIYSDTRGDNIGILTCTGKMLIGEGDELLREKINALVDNGRPRILLDLSDVPYVDAAGLGEIVRCYTTASRKNGILVLLGLSRRIHDLLSITKMLSVFEVFEVDEQEKAITWLEDYPH